MEREIGNENLSLDFFYDVLFNDEKISLTRESINKVQQCFNFLEEFAEGKVIYGITTGFGPMAQHRISDKDRKQLQYNLIRSHSSGVGNHIPPLYVKAAMICRLINILQAKSGIHSESAILLKDFTDLAAINIESQLFGIACSRFIASDKTLVSFVTSTEFISYVL